MKKLEKKRLFSLLNYVRFHTTFHLHHKATKISWYKKWHNKRYAHHLHVAIFIVYVLSIFFAAFIHPSQTHAALTEQTKTINSGAEFKQGELSNAVVGDDDDVSLRLYLIKSLSNSNGGGWKHKKEISINGTTAGLQTDYQVLLIINTEQLISSGKMQPNGADIRLTNYDKQELPYWVESGINTTGTRIWVKVDYISAAPEPTTLNIFYGNELATSSSSSSSVFEVLGPYAQEITT
ncbi:MAG: DUF2341 domain-containing protein, partial [Candidatus Izemoplasmatales bacterium]|nr:DUF2341 domain-containing protein [Candidatus Izemoplasmatales bacterium]